MSTSTHTVHESKEVAGLNKVHKPEVVKKDVVKERKDTRQSRLDKLEKSVVLSPARVAVLQTILKESGADSASQVTALKRIQDLFNPPVVQLSKDEESELKDLIKLNENEDNDWTPEQDIRLNELETRVELAKINAIVWGS